MGVWAWLAVALAGGWLGLVGKATFGKLPEWEHGWEGFVEWEPGLGVTFGEAR